MTRADLFAAEPLGDVLFVNGMDAAAEFFIDHQLAALHLQTGLEVEQVRAQRGHGGAAPALPHKLQRVQNKAGVHLLRQALQVRGDIGGAHPLVAALRALNGQQADAGGEHPAVHHIHPLQLLTYDPGVIEGAGKLGADVQMDDLIALGKNGGEKVLNLLKAGGGGFGKGAVLPVTPVHIGRREVGAVQKAFVAQKDGERQNFYIKTGKQLRRQITGAVCGDHYGFAHDVSQLLTISPSIYHKRRRIATSFFTLHIFALAFFCLLFHNKPDLIGGDRFEENDSGRTHHQRRRLPGAERRHPRGGQGTFPASGQY